MLLYLKRFPRLLQGHLVLISTLYGYSVFEICDGLSPNEAVEAFCGIGVY